MGISRRAEGKEGPAFIGSMTEEKSVELASKIASEGFLFGVGALLVFLEYDRTRKKELRKQQQQRRERQEIADRAKEERDVSCWAGGAVWCWVEALVSAQLGARGAAVTLPVSRAAVRCLPPPYSLCHPRPPHPRRPLPSAPCPPTPSPAPDGREPPPAAGD